MRGKVIGAALVATVAVGILGAVAVRSGESLPGTTVAGVDVGQLDRSALRSAISDLTDARTKGELVLLAPDLEAAVDRGLATVDLEGTVDRAMDAGRVGSPLAGVLGPLLGSGDRSVELAVTVDEDRLGGRLDELAKKIDRPSSTGGFTITGLDVKPELPQQGRTLERDKAQEAVGDALRSGRQEALTLPVTLSEPTTTADDVTQVSEAARRALSAPYLLGDDPTLRLSQREVGPLLSAKLEGDTLTLAVDEETLTALVTKQAKEVDVAPRSAGISIVDMPVPVLDGKGNLSYSPIPAAAIIEPGATGRSVDVPATTAKLAELILAGSRTKAPLPLVTTQPALTTEAAQSVNSLIGTFTTYFQAGQPRAKNIALIAQIIDGTTIAPGAAMSLNQTAGRRTRERGFVEDGAILDGELVKAVGGGVSQFATTLFNAAFFAGLPIPAHQPHSFYISRYPVGRESTVNFPTIDVKIVNDTKSGILVRTRSTAGSVTVELYGNNGGRLVTAEHGPRQPRPDGGFRIAVTRTVSGGDGVSSRRVFTTSYNPAPKS